MLLTELDFPIPERLIAQSPAEPRDACRLMYLAADGARHHLVFSQLPGVLRPGDTLVFNDSRVLPARVHAHKPTGAQIELLFLHSVGAPSAGNGGGAGESWEVLARPSHRLRPGGRLVLPDGTEVALERLLGEGRWVVRAPEGRSLVAIMEAHGLMPLPPYIKTYPEKPSSYQTVYASVLGSAAAPTAGLHFTPELLAHLDEAGIRSAYVTLHVGLDTFLPIRECIVEDHRIHRETYSVTPEALHSIRAARQSGGRLVAVGTTATRVLETVARAGVLDGCRGDTSVGGSTDIFITPGHRFRAVDALLTNFHLPRSTVLALTMAFAGVERLREAYAEALDLEYRFFSFGDAMLIDAPAAAEGGDHADA
ncbi:MAG: tRNA preQ1(34) S-adenosylmethionine ribosyltransferase-isomerase QueA [Thermoleophilia bacterium]|nr:tRNA preQ1(34) S-adenosylmethionine ribosyltransferase-isomerase QueA [Thermoleophilia bacterium]